MFHKENIMTSAFDDEELQGNFVNVNSYDDEDDDVMDNWEDVLDEEEEAEKKKKEVEAEEARKKLEKEKRVAKREEERMKNEQLAALMSAKPLSKAEQEQAQLEAAERAASDLFGTDENVVITSTKRVAAMSMDSFADSVDTYVPIESEDFPELARRIMKKLRKYEADEGYHQFVRDLIPELCKEMTSEEIKKISNPMTNLSHEKARLEKEAKKKAGSTKKISLAANKKVVNSSSLLDEYANDDYDDYDDGIDFM